MLGRLRLILVSVILGWQFVVFAQRTPTEKSIPQDTTIELKRFADAFGNGDEYRVKVAADGTVLFEKFKDFKISNTVKSRITCEQLGQLISEFERIDFFSLKDKYQRSEDGCPEMWSDRTHSIVSIRINGKSKSINHYHGCMDGGLKSIYPRLLTELEMKIDEIIGTKQWLR